MKKIQLKGGAVDNNSHLRKSLMNKHQHPQHRLQHQHLKPLQHQHLKLLQHQHLKPAPATPPPAPTPEAPPAPTPEATPAPTPRSLQHQHRKLLQHQHRKLLQHPQQNPQHPKLLQNPKIQIQILFQNQILQMLNQSQKLKKHLKMKVVKKDWNKKWKMLKM